jgi:anthranilate synthase component 1
LISQRVVEAGFDLLDLHSFCPERYPFLLESSAAGPHGRYDILFAYPGEVLDLLKIEDADFLSELDRHWAQVSIAPSNSELPFRGGWFLYLGYELAGQIEPQLQLPSHKSGLPVASATRIPAAIIHDHLHNERTVVAESDEQMQGMLEDISSLAAYDRPDNDFPHVVLCEDEPQEYLDAVAQVKRYIREGDVFQVNLSRQWRGDWPKGALSASLYRKLRSQNPGPFNGLAYWGDRAVLSSSPEQLVAVRGDDVQTRPIAGTRPRGRHAAEDKALEEELHRHPKERAEHIMLIDLERNDLGRIAVPGSVEVTELMSLERYATVHHIVSNVTARKRTGVTPGEVIRAVFPGGTITGCPKVRCMEIIAELEKQPRGAYTGSMGYLNHDGDMDLNILIRTIVRDGDSLGLRAGAGIVHDSEPLNELEETRAKAAGMLNAISAGSG